MSVLHARSSAETQGAEMISYTMEMDEVTKERKLTEVLTEKVCFRISPEYISKHALAILSVLQCYMHDCKAKAESWNIIHKQNRRHVLHFLIACSNTAMRTFLFYWLSKENKYYGSLQETADLSNLGISLFDYYVDITPEKIAAVVKTGHLHFHQGIGILIGCNSKALPELPTKDSHETGTLILSSNCLDLFPPQEWESMFGDKFKSVITISQDGEEYMLPEVIAEISEAEAVIGRRGFVTYAGSSLKKPVLDLVEPNEEFWFLTQWSNPNYVPVVLYPTFDVREGVERLWDQVITFRGDIITMAPEMSFVGNVDDS